MITRWPLRAGFLAAAVSLMRCSTASSQGPDLAGDPGLADAGLFDAGPQSAMNSSDAGVDAGRPDASVASDAGVQRPRVLFIGNSLTAYNELHLLVAALAADVTPTWREVEVQAWAPGGVQMWQHLASVKSPMPSALRQALVTGSAAERRWTFVVLQEQSQIPGLSGESPEFDTSLEAFQDFGPVLAAVGARPVLYMTWGFWNGDPTVPGLYDDFLSMSALLEAGYRAYVPALEKADAGSPLMAPVGLAFRAVHEDERRAFRDPLQTSSLFRRLYADDRHPTLLGSYLAAAVLVGAMTGERVRDAGYLPMGLDPGEGLRLRTIADQVVFEGRRPDAGP